MEAEVVGRARRVDVVVVEVVGGARRLDVIKGGAGKAVVMGEGERGSRKSRNGEERWFTVAV